MISDSFVVTFPVFAVVMLTMIAVGAALTVWVVRDRLRPTPARPRDVDTDEHDLSMFVERCRSPACPMCDDDGQVCGGCGKPDAICVCPASAASTLRSCPICSVTP